MLIYYVYINTHTQTLRIYLEILENASFIMGFIVLDSSRRDTASQYGEGRNISVTCLRYSANHNAPDSWPIRARLASQNDELCKNRRVSERRSNNNVQYVENNVFVP